MNHSLITHTLPLDRTLYLAAKRGLDVVGATALLLLLAPTLLLIGLAIKLDTCGPVLFAQERVGLRRVRRGSSLTWEIGTFTCYKFRTMCHNADSTLHQAFVKAFIANDTGGMARINGDDATARKITRDPRVTRVGRCLRATSLDELPQLWNVLRGEMSLVGPRPPIPYEVALYQDWHLKRLEAIPGLTGMWQVTARSRADFDEMVRLDLYYITHQSLWLDLKILLKTPLAVFKGKGAC